jgi:hypothetical protein
MLGMITMAGAMMEEEEITSKATHGRFDSEVMHKRGLLALEKDP